VGRVIDFGVLKSIVGQWIDDRLDHGYLMHPDDLIGQHIRDQGFKVYAMPVDLGEPTAENLARLVLREATRLLAEHPVVVRHVRVFETPNCWADVEQEA
jgi:6-pyruvoyltetrahydropterin/6-carboxytetrahydropterin synthase